MTGAGDEFELIATHFAPLAANPQARGLKDDAALIDIRGALVVTTDMVVEGVHFRAEDPLETIARKALRVNLSDLAAKGARPVGYLLGLSWPDTHDAAGVGAIAAGLGADQAIFSCSLFGGDTTRTPGPLTISITAFGAPIGERTPARADALAGDDLWVTGWIGDGLLGLEVLEGRCSGLSDASRTHLIDRYRLPEPRTAFAAAIARFAHASMDVSDGLLGDAGKIAAASGLRLVIAPEQIPLSPGGQDWLAQQPVRDTALARLANGGDDYEILFTAAPAVRGALREAAAEIGLPLALLGRAEQGQGVVAGDLAIGGHTHRLGAASTNRKP